MFRRVTMAAVVAVVAAAMVAPARPRPGRLQHQVEYGDDVYGGTEGSTATESGGSAEQSAGAWTKFTASCPVTTRSAGETPTAAAPRRSRPAGPRSAST